MNHFFIDRIFRLPRVWSNQQLKQHAHLFSGDVVNVSAWQDFDKVDTHYRAYFTKAASYTVTNFGSSSHGYQGTGEEIYLDLERPLPPDLHHRFDVVFNHTTLEHIFDMQTAFANLCAMSRDVVIIVLPFLQRYHSDMGDYWRFTPQAVRKMFENEQFTPLYQRHNQHRFASVYTYTVASRHPEQWQHDFDPKISLQTDAQAGASALLNLRYRAKTLLRSLVKK